MLIAISLFLLASEILLLLRPLYIAILLSFDK